MSAELQPIPRTERLTEKPEWSDLLETALTMPGSLGNTYSRFYNYSFGNQILLWMQGVQEPVNTYKRWAGMDRQVKRGSKAKAIMVPLIRTVENDKGERERQVTGFKLLNCLFTLSETDGEELPPYEPPTWSRERAMGELGIRQTAFDMMNGNVAGFSVGHELAINPVAKWPFKTLAHEMAHIVLGHTAGEGVREYQQHRGLMEFGAEGTAFLVLNELGAQDQMDESESRAYIQHWLRDQRPDDRAIKQVFSATDKILQAGYERPLSSLDASDLPAHSEA